MGDDRTRTIAVGPSGRRVTVHVPQRRFDAVVFAADGAVVGTWGPLLDRADLPPTLLVAAHAAPGGTARLQEYVSGLSSDDVPADPARFDAHESFFVDRLRSWVQQELGRTLPPPARTAAFGASAGGELALALGLRHPDVYGVVLCASPGAGFRPGGELPSELPRFELLAGTDEPFFLDNARRWATTLHRAGAAVTLTEVTGEHGEALWRREFPQLVARGFAG